MNAASSTLRKVSILLCALAVPVGLVAQEHVNKTVHHHYKLIDLGTLGGTRSYFSPGSDTEVPQFSRVLNDGGAVAGLANTSLPDPFPDVCFDLEGDCLVTHAFEAHGDGKLKDLGALPGGGSSAATSISNNGLVAGLSQNGEIDPLLPAFSLPPFPEIRAVLWRNGQIIDLGTLPQGGYESYATAVNSRGQVVGAAIDTVPDPNSMAVSALLGLFWLGPFPYETRAFLWEEDEGMQDLGTLPGSRDAQAILINEAGQVVGYSYTGTAPSVSGCVFQLTTGSFVWEKGKGMQDLGSFGGTCTFAMDLNDRGQIVGESTTAGDQAAHAFLWDHGVMHDLGGSLGGNVAGAIAINQSGRAVGFASLPGDTTYHATLWTRIGHVIDLGVIGADQCSQASSINAQMQIVGLSSPDCFATTVRAFLWEEGAMLDLNALIPADSALYLQFTETINSRGEIAGTGSDVHGNTHAFLLIPCDENHPDIHGCDYSPVEVTTDAASHVSAEAAARNPLSAEDISRIRALLMKRHRGFMPRTMH